MSQPRPIESIPKEKMSVLSLTFHCLGIRTEFTNPMLCMTTIFTSVQDITPIYSLPANFPNVAL